MKQLYENDALLLKELTDKFLEACPELQLGQMFISPLHIIENGKCIPDVSADGMGFTGRITPARSIHIKYPLTAEFMIGAREIITRENLAHPTNPVKYFHPYMAFMPAKHQYETLKLGDKMPAMSPDFTTTEIEVTQHHLDQFSAVVFRFALSL
jgi:hypothetical protein